MQYALIILLVIALVVLGPLLTLWGLNTLFPVLAIPYTIKTWLATWFVFGIGLIKGRK